MSYSNGRIYTETVGGQQVGVSIYDVQRAVPVTLRRTVNGVVERKSSSDLGVLVSAKVGETIPASDGKGNWTVDRRTEINPWARYRPIPCMSAANNTPKPITPAQRIAEIYGVDQPIDMFKADSIVGYEDYAESVSKYGLYYLPLRAWGDTHWKRLTDFVKTDNNGNKTSLGYDHNAKPDNVKITINNTDHYLAPLIPEGQRTLYIPAGSTNARFMFPVDHIWMNTYYEFVYGTATGVSVEHNEEWLSPIDFMGRSTYYDPESEQEEGHPIRTYATVRRRIIIFRWEDSYHRIEGDTNYNEYDAKWRFYNLATDIIPTNSAVWNSTDRPFDKHPNAWLDLTDSEGTDDEGAENTASNSGQRRLRTLTGRCLFVDCWVEDNSSVNVFPILGYTYEVYIDRTADVNVDVSGVITFSHVGESSGVEEGTTYYFYEIFVDYDPNKLGLEAGLVDAGERVVGVLEEYYDSLSIQLGSHSINLLDTTLAYETDTGGAGDWFRLHCVVYQNAETQLGIQTATVYARRKGLSVTATKIISVTQ